MGASGLNILASHVAFEFANDFDAVNSSPPSPFVRVHAPYLPVVLVLFHTVPLVFTRFSQSPVPRLPPVI